MNQTNLEVYNDSLLSRTHKIVHDEGLYFLSFTIIFIMTNKHPVKTPDVNEF